MTSMSVNPVAERYLYPEDFAGPEVHSTSDAAKGFFKVGDDLVCYGRCSFVSPSSCLGGNLPDVLGVMTANRQSPTFPFDPGEVVDNLRRERYVSAAHSDDLSSGFMQACRGLYYRLRPFMPLSLRARVKKAYIAGWEKKTFPRWPVDRTADLLLERLLELSLKAQQKTDIAFIWFWPDGFESSAIMTHDVETSAGLDFLNTVMEMDESVGIRASVQLVPEERYVVTETLLCEIRSRGFEVNVHDLNHDGRLFDNRQEFLSRAKKINAYARGFGAKGYRSGAMYRNSDWYDAFEFEYDMSVPNVAHLDPQHGGCCTVMPYFIGDILELPLTTVQDYFLFYVLHHNSIDLWKQQIEMIRSQHGMMSFIVHPDYVIDAQHRAWFKTLLEHLQVLRGDGTVWFALPGEVNQWWRQRSKMRLKRKGSGWSIEGEGSERALIAYAYLQDGKLAYRIDPPPAALPSASAQRQVQAVNCT
jgi:hypothetical protein